MELKRSNIGRRYIRMVTKSSLFFPMFVLLGVALIVFMMINTKVDVISTHQLTVVKNGSEYTLVANGELETQIIPDKIFLYEARNEAVYQMKNVVIQNISTSNSELSQANWQICFDPDSNADNESLMAFLDENIGANIKADIPVGKISLLKRIFTRGGAEN